ncbi:MAG: hypothetical protein WDO16_23635 [Bacteroidota bacterium]
MKSLSAILIAILSASLSYASPKKDIRVKGTIHAIDKPRFGGNGKIVILKGGGWEDTLKTLYIKNDGSFHFSLPDSLIGYQLFFMKPGYCSQHIQVYPELGNYDFDIVLNPGNLQSLKANNKVTWYGSQREVQEAVYKAGNNIPLFELKMVDFLSAAMKDKSDTVNHYGFDLETELSRIEGLIQSATNPEVKKILLIEYLCIDAVQQKVLFKRKAAPGSAAPVQLFKGKAKTAILEQLISEISPSSALWNIEFNSIRWLVRQIPLTSDLVNYAERVIAEQATPQIAASVLYGLAQRYQEENRRDDFAITLTRLVTDYPGLHPTNRAKAEFSLFSSLTVGTKVPDFAVASIDKPGETITPASMKGKTYLIEFWTLWCKGCLMAIPYITKRP